MNNRKVKTVLNRNLIKVKSPLSKDQSPLFKDQSPLIKDRSPKVLPRSPFSEYEYEI